MSTWGRAQDALFNLLDGMEISMDGKRQPGLLEGKLTFDEISALIEPILESVAPIFSVGPSSSKLALWECPRCGWRNRIHQEEK